MDIVIFLKPIVDMFYQIRLLDYILMAFVILFFLFSLKKADKLLSIDMYIVFLMLLYTATLLRTGSGTIKYVKIISAFLMYFLGRFYHKKNKKCEKNLVRTSYIVLSVNILVIFLGKGAKIWGHAVTVVGMYYFKADFAIAMLQILCAIIFFMGNYRGIFQYWPIVLILLSGVLIFLSNSRAAIVIFFCIVLMYILYCRELKTGKRISFSPPVMLKIGVIGVIGIFVIVWVSSLHIFKELNFLTFQVASVTNLFSTENLSGRNMIWESIWNNFQSSNILSKMFGVDLVGATWESFGSHNTYLMVLYNIGYVGLFTLLVFVIRYLIRINKLKDRKIFYFNVSMLIIFLLQGISMSAIEFTQMTWIVFYFMGMAISKQREERNFRKNTV